MQHQAVVATGRFNVAPESWRNAYSNGTGPVGRSFAGERPQSGRSRRNIFLPLLAGLLLLTCYAALLQRVHVVRLIPGTAGIFRAAGMPVNIFQAEFQNIRANLSTRDGEAQLVVEGQIRNTRAMTNSLRDVQLSLLGLNGVVVYSWVAKLPQKSLKAGETLSFKTSLASPPAGNHNVALTFVR